MLYRHYLKRAFDIVLAMVVLLVFSPLLVLITILLLFANRGTPFFFQARPGRNERIFKLIKFKTMNDKKDAHGVLLHDAKRLTMVGRFLRKTSFDELPQLINILKGDMSVIGPRPMFPEYLPLYSEKHRRRHEVRPGVTGLAQLEGRNKVKFSRRFDLDVEYVDKLSFSLDCKILVDTFFLLFKTADVVNGQTVDEVDDLGITQLLSSNHFKPKTENEY